MGSSATRSHKSSIITQDDLSRLLRKSEEEQSMLLSLSKAITCCRSYQDVQEIVSNQLLMYFKCGDTMIYLNDDIFTHKCYLHAVSKDTMNRPEFTRVAAMSHFINDGIFNTIENSTEPVIFDMEELMRLKYKPFYIEFWHSLQVKEIIGFPIRINRECIGCITLSLKEKDTFNADDLELTQALCSYIGIALSNIWLQEKMQCQLEEINSYRSHLEQKNIHQEEQMTTACNYEEIIGTNNGLREVFQLVSHAAPSDSTVLIMGETGTGKELIASAIHHMSPRRQKTMVKVNCAAFPSHLVESELFGHEKGSFTGATERRIGKFELANNSTLFLDEIGEMGLELQAKLLRALQEKEIERIGGKAVIKTDVRIIVASNRDLKKEVEAGRFRSDLFYRLNVFPIILPALRDRMEDIPILVSYFINKFSHKAGNKIKNISPKAVRDLTLYSWPGNVRELEHIIERSVLMTNGDTITDVQLSKARRDISDSQEEGKFKSLEENEREYILSALKTSKGRIRGWGGAAELLKIPPTTLHSKMKKLGIRKTGN